MVWKFFDKRSKKVLGSGIENKQLADELHKPVIKKIKRRKVYSSSKGNKFLKKNAFQKILNSSMELHLKRKPSKIWVDKGSQFYNNAFKNFLKNNDTEMYSTPNEGKSVFAERFIRTLENKIYKHMTTVGKNIHFNVLDDIVDKYNNPWHSSIKMKPKDVTDSSFAEYSEDFDKKDPKFKVGDHVRISKYKHIFANGYTPNWSKEILVAKKIKNTVPWTYVINGLNGEKKYL